MSKKEPRNPRLGVVGGQAVLEGVMMRHGERYSVSVRKEDGSITTENRTFVSVRKKIKLLNIPLLRGAVNFIEMLILSYKTLSISADAYGLTEEEEESKFERWLREHFGKGLVDVVMAISMVLGLALGVGIFFFFPSLLTKATDNALGGSLGWAKNLIEGLIKIVIFIAYLWLVSLMPDIRRTFEYHGAEHKTVHCYEHAEALEVENVRRYSCLHKRCGTNLLLIVMILSILIFSIIQVQNPILRIVLRILLLPVVAGVSYEALKLIGRYDNWFTRAVSAPGMLLQKLTTSEPDDGQMEVAIAALSAVTTGDRADDAW